MPIDTAHRASWRLHFPTNISTAISVHDIIKGLLDILDNKLNTCAILDILDILDTRDILDTLDILGILDILDILDILNLLDPLDILVLLHRFV